MANARKKTIQKLYIKCKNSTPKADWDIQYLLMFIVTKKKKSAERKEVSCNET